MDQGIIMNFKQNYRRLLISKWYFVTQVCIQNCYRRGGFQQTAETVSDNDDDNNDIPLLNLQNNWCQLATTTNTSENVDFETYASIDDELILADRPTDDIVASIINPEENNDDDDDTEVTSEEDLINDREALLYISKLQRKLSSKSTVPEKMFNNLSDIDTFFQKCTATSLVQKTVKDFF